MLFCPRFLSSCLQFTNVNVDRKKNGLLIIFHAMVQKVYIFPMPLKDLENGSFAYFPYICLWDFSRTVNCTNLYPICGGALSCQSEMKIDPVRQLQSYTFLIKSKKSSANLHTFVAICGKYLNAFKNYWSCSKDFELSDGLLGISPQWYDGMGGGLVTFASWVS